LSYQLPTFNLDVRLWRWVNWNLGVPPTAPPDLLFKGQLRLFRTAFMSPNPSSAPVRVALLVAKGTAIQGRYGWFTPTNVPDLVEVPAGTGRYYTVAAVDDVARGFSNEYRFCRLEQNTAPIPLP
jgi:hypothetical protein